MFNNITDNLDRIIGHLDIAHQDITRYQGIINNGNEQVQGLRNELANARNQLTLLNISLDNERIEAFNVQQSADDALNNEREACQWRVDAITNALNNERTARQYHQASAQNRQERIGELLREKFAFLLINKRYNHQLRQCRGNSALLEYNRDRLYDRYLKWKQKTQNERMVNQNLNLQLIALQNNPSPIIVQNQSIAYRPPKYSGLPSEDLEEHIR